MCGIAGALGRLEKAQAGRIVEDICRQTSHRGPDATSVWTAQTPLGCVALGHNRLSIIDLSSASNQPFASQNGRRMLAFNGEIYNYVEIRRELEALGHSFATSGDTEVLLRAYDVWGADAFPRFNGMFAISIWDEDKQSLILVRDRFGVKPLYYGIKDGLLVWSSETRPVASALGLKPSMEYLRQGMASWNYERDTHLCPYEGMQQVQAGCWAQAELGAGGASLTQHRWYRFAERVHERAEELSTRSREALIDETRSTLEDAVRLRLRADVPVALALSGGLDSSSVGAMLNRLGANIRAISVGDPKDQSTEGPLADLIARSLGLPITWIRVEEGDYVEGWLPTLESQDSPYVSGAQVAHKLLCREVRAQGVKVLLGGQGGDECLMGYRKYLVFALRHMQRKRNFTGLAGAALGSLPALWEERSQILYYGSHRKRFSGADSGGGRLKPFPVDTRLNILPGESDRDRQIRDVLDASIPTLLRYEDRNTMAHSLEGRLPFMDYRMMELGCALPTNLKVRSGYGKWILRQAMKDMLPREVTFTRKKVGFFIKESDATFAAILKRLHPALDEVWPSVRGFYASADCPEQAYPAEVLRTDRSAMTELLGMIWYGRRMG